MAHRNLLIAVACRELVFPIRCILLTTNHLCVCVCVFHSFLRELIVRVNQMHFVLSVSARNGYVCRQSNGAIWLKPVRILALNLLLFYFRHFIVQLLTTFEQFTISISFLFFFFLSHCLSTANLWPTYIVFGLDILTIRKNCNSVF